ncbi:MAG: peptide chain release factor 2 [Acidobacteriota bacterium]
MLDELKQRQMEQEKLLEELRGFLEIGHKRDQVAAIDHRLAEPAVWSDQEALKVLNRDRKRLTATLERFDHLERDIGDAGALLELIEEGEAAAEVDYKELLKKIEGEAETLRLETLFSDEADLKDCYLEIHAGSGGTDSQDWAQMLLRMYLRFCENMQFVTTIVDTQPGEEAGIKSATVSVEGAYAFGYLKEEVGVHRLVRISPFDSNARRHTSFAAVFAYPQVDESIKIEIDEKDLRVDTYRSSGHGGQHINVTDSAIRITHLPSGIVVTCQNERSQHRNRDMAMKILRSRLVDLEREKQLKRKQEIEDAKKDISWGSQIRSYVLQPYQMVKDHRTKLEIGDVNRVLDGDLEGLIKAALYQSRRTQAT